MNPSQGPDFLLARIPDIRYMASMEKLWEIRRPPPDLVREVAENGGIDTVVAALLVNRGISDASEVERFLSPRLDGLRAPFALKDVSKAARRIAEALSKKEKILIFGDYDVDGVTAAAVVYEFLKSLQAHVSVYIPHRIREGYGLKPEHVTRVIGPGRFTLVITVDCGSGSREALQAAARKGVHVIVTDHHRMEAALPEAFAVVNPNGPDCASGFGHLAGVGVAYFLVIVLRAHLREAGYFRHRAEPNLRRFCDLVALGTVADMAPMVRENRILTQEGLNLIRTGRRIGIRALAESAGTRLESMDAESLAFRLAPRLNAAGRMAHAALAFDLLRETDLHAARQEAGRLNEMNARRQRMEKEILDDIEAQLRSDPQLLKKRTLVLSAPHWHEGLLGIVASKVVEKYHRMTVLLSTKDGMAKGSARGVPGLDLFGFLFCCRQFIDDFGGHQTAAGLKLQVENMAHFSRAFEETVRKGSRMEDFIPRVTIDWELDFDRITPSLIDALDRLKPHGPGNPAPLFMSRNVQVIASKNVGEVHRKMQLAQAPGPGSRILEAIQFNVEPDMPPRSSFSRIAYRLSWNHWQGHKTIQAIIEESL